MDSTDRLSLHVLIPAAGLSRRMGQPKLLMKLQGQPLIQRLVRQLHALPVESISVLARESDQDLRAALSQTSAHVVIPHKAPEEMRVSVELLVDDLRKRMSPRDQDGWVLIPADHPVVHQSVFDQLFEVWKSSPKSVVLPTYRGKRGHPAIFPWSLSQKLAEIPRDHGLNWLTRHPDVEVLEVDCGDESVLWDIDTPEDFERIREILDD